MNRRKQCGILLAVILVLFIGCSSQKPDRLLKGISDAIRVDVSAGEVLSEEDSHGGFHGDGSAIVEIRFKENTIEEEIREPGDWKALPLTENLMALVYGIHSEYSSVGPMVHDGTGTPIIPTIENGYYYFYDRHAESLNPGDDSDVIGRASYNFTIAIYDTDNRILYYIEFDT